MAHIRRRGVQDPVADCPTMPLRVPCTPRSSRARATSSFEPAGRMPATRQERRSLNHEQRLLATSQLGRHNEARLGRT